MKRKARILVFDIEVASYKDVVDLCKKYGLNEWKLSWKIDAGTHYVTHISYGWLGEEAVTDLSLLDHKGSLIGDANEKAMLEDFIKAWNSADETVAHYGSKFDLNFLNSRIAMYGLPRLKPAKIRDTWRILKNHFALVRNTLEEAIRFFKCPYGKPKLDQEVWRKVAAGNVAAFKILRNRCRFDVKSLRWIYDTKLQAYDTDKGNRALAYSLYDIDDKEVARQLTVAQCKQCEKTGTLKREGFSYLKVNTMFQLSCKTPNCGWSTAPLQKFIVGKHVRYRLGRIR